MDLESGISKLCPNHTKLLGTTIDKFIVHTFDGNYIVKTNRYIVTKANIKQNKFGQKDNIFISLKYVFNKTTNFIYLSSKN